MLRCKHYLYHLQFVFNLNTTFWVKNTLLIKNTNLSKILNQFYGVIFQHFDLQNMGVCRQLFTSFTIYCLNSIIWNTK